MQMIRIAIGQQRNFLESQIVVQSQKLKKKHQKSIVIKSHH